MNSFALFALAISTILQQSPTSPNGAATMPESTATRPVESLEARQLLAADAYDWKPATIKANGFIDGIVYSPTESGLAYIHTDMGGAYRYDVSRSKWTNLTDFAKYTDSAGKSMGVETLAIDPTDANRVYIGLGTYMQNSAVLRSTDRGVTWQRTDVPFQMNGNGSGRSTGERMMVDPNSPNILYYGTRDDGLFKSIDHAATWSKVNSFPTIGLDTGWGQDTGILFVQFDTTSGSAGAASQTIYVGVFDPTAGATRTFRSSDAGATWAALPGGQPTTANLFPQRSVLTPDGKTLYLTYATSTTYPGPYGVLNGQVWKVTNPGSATPTWTNVTPPTTYSYSAITLDPTDPNTVYTSEMGDYNPADRIWRSKDAGVTWTVISPNANRDDSSAQYAKSLNVHWMGDVEIDPTNRDVAMFTTGYGLYRTTNLTAATPKWTFFNDGFEQSAALEIASPNGGPVNLFDAIGDRDGYRHDDFDQSPAIGLLGQNTGMNKGTSDDIDVAWNDANTLVRVVRVSPYVQWSADNGITWKWVSSTNVSGGNGGSLALSGDGTRVVYEPAGTGRTIYSTRTGSAWSAWTAPATNRPIDGSKLTVDLVDGMTFYAQSGRTISRSTDGGANWTVMTTTAPSGISWTRAVPGNAGHLISSAGGSGVWRSTNGGATWTRLAGNAVTDAYAAGVGAAAPGKTYPSLFIAGTMNGATGFHRSDDEGATWTTISDVNHQFGAVTVIQGDPRVFGRLYVGTNGRGIQIGEPLKAPTTLPIGWIRDDIGSPALAGQSGSIGGVFTLVGTGTGVSGTSADQFHFASTEVGGDVRITARVYEVANVSTTAQAGVMLRADASPGAAFAMVSMLANGTVVFTWRASTGTSVQSTSATGTFATAKFLSLARTGGQVAAAYSTDGLTWTALSPATAVDLPQRVRIGLAASSGTGTALAKVTVTDVFITADTVAPEILDSDFDYQSATKSVRIRFSEDVSASLTAADLVVSPVKGGSDIAPTGVTFDTDTMEATFLLPANLSIGDYTASFAPGRVSDRAGNDLAAAPAIQFFNLPGDVNRDRSVDFSDLVIVAQHYGENSASFDSGDLTGDGAVGFDDLVVLAQNYGQSLNATQSTIALLPPLMASSDMSKSKKKRV